MVSRSRPQRTCVMCGRVGTRVFTCDARGRTVCRNASACVTRLCDKAFLDPGPQPWHHVASFSFMLPDDSAWLKLTGML